MLKVLVIFFVLHECFSRFLNCANGTKIACNFTKSNTPPRVFFTFFKLQKWYQIAKRITYNQKETIQLVLLESYVSSAFVIVKSKHLLWRSLFYTLRFMEMYLKPLKHEKLYIPTIHTNSFSTYVNFPLIWKT